MSLLHLESTTSTMDDARRLLEQGNTQTTIILADEQTAGRGRHNRPWTTFSAPHSMAATFILRPQVGPHLPLLVALALYDAVLPHTAGLKLQIKWPNDLLLEGKKLSGILCENVTDKASIIGIGLNLFAPKTVPDTFQGTFLGLEIPPKTLAESIRACLQANIALYGTQGWTKTLHQSYVQRCATIGQTIHWKVPQSAENTELTGLVRGLTPNGHLELVAEDGTMHVIHSGEIFDKR